MADASYPNKLKAARQQHFLTRAGLAALTARVALEDPVRFHPITDRAIERLERGENRPRARVAACLAKVLGLEPGEVFPLGPAA